MRLLPHPIFLLPRPATSAASSLLHLRRWENLTATNPKRQRCRARIASLLSPVNLKNRPILALLFTMVAGISMTALHPTNLRELQNLIKIHMIRERIPMIPTLRTEVNGGKVLCTTEDSNLMISSPIHIGKGLLAIAASSYMVILCRLKQTMKVFFFLPCLVWRQYAQSNKLFWCVFSGLCSLLLLAFAFSFLFL